MIDTRTWEERARAAEAGCAEFRKILGDEKRATSVVTVVAKRRGWTVRVHTVHADGTFDLEEEKVIALATMRVILESASSLVHVALLGTQSGKFSEATTKAADALYQQIVGKRDNEKGGA